MNPREDFRPGDQVIYHDTYSTFGAVVIEASGDAQWERYKLRVEGFTTTGLESSPNFGEEFECKKKRGTVTRLLWYLTER